MHCLYAVKDDLHDYAEAIHASMSGWLKAAPIAERDFQAFESAVLNRTRNLQTEVVRINPGVQVPLHTHPGIDTIDFLVAGNVTSFSIAGRPFERLVPKMGLRIAETAAHGGKSGPTGVIFVSCQRWDRSPGHIALAWRGTPVGERHRALLELADDLEKVR